MVGPLRKQACSLRISISIQFQNPKIIFYFEIDNNSGNGCQPNFEFDYGDGTYEYVIDNFKNLWRLQLLRGSQSLR